MDSFSSVIGHEKIKKLLFTLYKGGEIPPFLIFEGPMGVGKAQMAYEFAKLIMYDGKKEPLMSPDFHLIQPMEEPEIDPSVGIRPLNFDLTKDIRIDSIRNLQKELSKKGTYEAHLRVVLILNGENLNTESQNSFLKTLEEPPSKTIIIMVTSHREKLLSTVYSRGRKFSFGSLNVQEFKEYPFYGEMPLLVLYSLSGGSIGRAKRIEKSFVFASRGQFLKNLSERDFTGIYNFLEEVSVDKMRTLEFLDMFSMILRDLYVVLHKGDVFVNDDIREEIIELAHQFKKSVIDALFVQIKKAYRMVEANVNRRYVLLSLITPLFPSDIRDKYDTTFEYLWDL